MKSKSSQQLQQELDAIIEWFESGEATIDEAEAKYKQGLEVAEQLQKQLKKTENTITKLKQTFEEAA